MVFRSMWRLTYGNGNSFAANVIVLRKWFVMCTQPICGQLLINLRHFTGCDALVQKADEMPLRVALFKNYFVCSTENLPEII